MTMMSPKVEARARQGFKYLNRLMVLFWRLGLGPGLNAWPEGLGRYMVLTHIGRKTGLRRHTPVNYALVDGVIYCTAGFGAVSDWYRNVRVNPAVEVWLSEGWWTGVAEEVLDQGERLPLLRQVLAASGFVAPALGLDPRSVSDDALAAGTTNYRLIRIRRGEPITGPGGPGDLSWVWPLTTFVLLTRALWRRERTRARCR